MLDIKRIRQNPQELRDALKARNKDISIDEFLAQDEQRRKLLAQVEEKKALRNAVKRGVKVEVMVSAHSDIPLTPDCVFYNVHRLMKHGVDVWIYEDGFHHTKVIMVDGKFCTVGSANLNSRSLNFDYEENAVIIDPYTTKELSDMFDNDKKSSFKLTEENWDKWRSPWKKFVGWFAHLLTPFL